MNCRNCGHPQSDHVTQVYGKGERPVVTVCFYPIHRNFDCPCARFERKTETGEGNEV